MPAERISPDYLAQQQEMHLDTEKVYGVSGHVYAQGVLNLAMVSGSSNSILDYGCGKQTLQNALPQFVIDGYDPAIPGLNDEPEPHDMVVCTDVLEHIEPELLDNVLDHIQSLARKVVFLTIATRPAKKTLPDGRNAHLIIESYEWWLPHIMKRWTIGTFQNVDDKTLIITAVPPNNASKAEEAA